MIMGLVGWLVLDLDVTDCKALLAELLWILVADGGGFKLDFLIEIVEEKNRGFKANTFNFGYFYSL
jgi:hypothetical protein